MDKNVDDILSKSQYGQKRRGHPQKSYMDKNLVNLSMDKNVEDIHSKKRLSKFQHGQKRRGYHQ